jgi:pimeloyl-ACP methyl ester carboxylesterase
MAAKTIHCCGREFDLNYTQLNPTQPDAIVILHGWGSHQGIMQQAFGSQLPAFKQFYLDLPGFGKSPNDVALTTHDYAQIVRIFLEQIGVAPRVVMGHSFGGKVATLLAPPCLVLLSSAGIRVPKSLKVRMKIALFKALKPFGIAKVRSLFVSSDAKGMNAGMYQTFKNVVDEDFSEHFAAFAGRGLCFWGRADTATPLWTGAQINKLLGNSRLIPMEGDHFFFLHHAGEIARTIEQECLPTDSQSEPGDNA